MQQALSLIATFLCFMGALFAACGITRSSPALLRWEWSWPIVYQKKLHWRKKCYLHLIQLIKFPVSLSSNSLLRHEGRKGIPILHTSPSVQKTTFNQHLSAHIPVQTNSFRAVYTLQKIQGSTLHSKYECMECRKKRICTQEYNIIIPVS